VPWNGPAYDIGVAGRIDTQTIDTACVGDVTISMTISHLGKLESSGATLDFLRVYYQIDGGSEVLWLNIVGEQYISAPKVTVASGSVLTIRTDGKTTHSSELYQIRAFLVSAAQVPMTLSPTKSPAPPTLSCAVPWNGPDYNIGSAGGTDTQTIDTSCVGDVTISMTISNLGSLESSGSGLDTLQVFYQIDGNPEVLWLNILGQLYTSPSAITVTSGSLLTMRVVGDTSSSSEVYQIRNFAVVPL
jgi:hypothetical protein